jgi:hypothetical protein
LASPLPAASRRRGADVTRERPDYGVPFTVSKEQEKLADDRVEFILFRMTRQDLTVRNVPLIGADMFDPRDATISMLRADLAAARALLEKAAEGLGPFVKWRDHVEAIGSRSLKDTEDPPIYGSPNMGNLRRARALRDEIAAALAKTTGATS